MSADCHLTNIYDSHFELSRQRPYSTLNYEAFNAKLMLPQTLSDAEALIVKDHSCVRCYDSQGESIFVVIAGYCGNWHQDLALNFSTVESRGWTSADQVLSIERFPNLQDSCLPMTL